MPRHSWLGTTALRVLHFFSISIFFFLFTNLIMFFSLLFFHYFKNFSMYGTRLYRMTGCLHVDLNLNNPQLVLPKFQFLMWTVFPMSVCIAWCYRQYHTLCLVFSPCITTLSILLYCSRSSIRFSSVSIWLSLIQRGIAIFRPFLIFDLYHPLHYKVHQSFHS